MRDAKYNAAGAMHRVAWALQNSKAIGQKREKPWENQGFAAERTGTELFPIFPLFFAAGRKDLLPSDSADPASNEPLRISLGIVTENGAGVDRVSKVLAEPLMLLSNCIDRSGDRNRDVFANPLWI